MAPAIHIPSLLDLSGYDAWWRDTIHDDIIKWKHFCFTFPLWGESTWYRWIPLTKASDAEFLYSFTCVWTNGWENNRNDGYLRRHRAHYDVTVMCISILYYSLFRFDIGHLPWDASLLWPRILYNGVIQGQSDYPLKHILVWGPCAMKIVFILPEIACCLSNV